MMSTCLMCVDQYSVVSTVAYPLASTRDSLMATICRKGRDMRILLVDSQPRVRFALRVLLERQPGLEVAGEASDADSLLTEASKAQPDLVLLGWELPGLTARTLLLSLRQICPHVFVIALSGRPEAREIALSAGADSFVSKADPPDLLLAAIDRYRCR